MTDRYHMISERLEISSHRTGKSKCLEKILVPGCVISRLFKCEHIKGGGEKPKKKKKKRKRKVFVTKNPYLKIDLQIILLIL